MAGGAILCFLAVAVLSTHIVRPLAQVIGVPLGQLVRFGDWLGTVVFRFPVSVVPGICCGGSAATCWRSCCSWDWARSSP